MVLAVLARQMIRRTMRFVAEILDGFQDKTTRHGEKMLCRLCAAEYGTGSQSVVLVMAEAPHSEP